MWCNLNLNRITFKIGILLLISLGCEFVCAQASNESEVLFFDDFSASELDRSKWNVYVQEQPFNNEQQVYVDSKKTIYTTTNAVGAKNGALVIHPRFRKNAKTEKGHTFDFISGRINTRNKFDFTYGFAEARIKLPNAIGVWPAWWALGNGNWPGTGEIDIMEYAGEKDWTAVAIHGPNYSGETPIVNKFFFELTDVTAWHIYGVECSPEEINFFVDGRLIYRVTKPMIEHYGKWVFDSPKFLILNFALGGAYPFKTNGITKPYNGMPQETVDLIKEYKVSMLVDWVRVMIYIEKYTEK